MKKTTVVLIIFLFSSFNFAPKKHRNKLKSFNFSIPTKAFAATALSGSNVFTTNADKANFIRYYYYLVNGPADDYTMPNNNYNYISVVNSYLDGVNTILGENGYSECSSIPTSGSASGDVNGLTFTLAFSAGTKTVPSTFPSDGGKTFEKRLVVSYAGTNWLEMQFKCTSSTTTTGYLLMGNQTLTDGTMYESTFQIDSSTNLTYLDFVVWVASNRKFITRFTTDDGTSYKLYALYIWLSNYNAVAINGKANGVTNFNTFYTTSNSTTTYGKTIDDISGITNGVNETAYNACLDLSTNTTSSGCATIASPGTITIGSTTYSFNFSSMSGLTTSTMP